MSVPILSYKDQHPAEVERAQTLRRARPCFKSCFTGYMTLDKLTRGLLPTLAHLSESHFPQAVIMWNLQDHPEDQVSRYRGHTAWHMTGAS